MRFNANKCYVMSIAQHPGTTFMYQLSNTLLKSVSSNPYLGILFSDHLTWNQYINNITKKANSTLGFIQRNLRRCPTACKKTAYLALVSPPPLIPSRTRNRILARWSASSETQSASSPGTTSPKLLFAPRNQNCIWRLFLRSILTLNVLYHTTPHEV